MQKLFSLSFSDTQRNDDIAHIAAKLNDIDKRITEAAPEWPLSKISKVDLAVLRLAVWELVYEKKTPPKVVIDEAVELSKSYGNEQSSKFINGALGTILKTT